MIGVGIPPSAPLHEYRCAMMSRSASPVQANGEVAFAICEAAALATHTQASLAVLWSRLGAFADDPSDLRRLAPHELEQLTALSEDVAELAGQIALILDGLPHAPLTAAEREISDAARATLAGGVADQRRAFTAAGMLDMREGFPALAQSLVDTDAHAFWTVRVVELLAAFRDVDDIRARQAAALAGVPETARFDELRPERVLELAHLLRQLAARPT